MPVGATHPTRWTRFGYVVTVPPRILIVDDERVNRDLIRAQLSAEAFEILEAHDGMAALSMVHSEPPDLVVCDVMMPGITGYEVVARLKADPRTEHVPVILFSSLNDRSSRSHGLAAGAAEHIDKLGSRHELIACIRRLLQLPEPER